MPRRKNQNSMVPTTVAAKENIPVDNNVTNLLASNLSSSRVLADDSPSSAPQAEAEADRTSSPSSLKSGDEQDQRKYNLPEGLSKMQRKNLRKNLRNKERKVEEKAGIRPGVLQLPEDPLQSERLNVLADVKTAYDALPSLAEISAADVTQCFNEQQGILDQLITTLVDAKESLCTKIKKPDSRRLSSQQLLDQIKDLSSMPDKDNVALSFLEEQLVLLVSWENARKLQTQFIELRTKLEERQRTNIKYVEAAKQRERMIKLAERVKVLKQLQPGTTQESFSQVITPSNIVSTEVDLSLEAQAALLPPSNIARRMERILGVAIDKSPSRQQQRTFVVSGMEKDVKEALRFLEEADFAGNSKLVLNQKVMPTFVGKGGAGIRQLEETFQCCFRIRDSTVIVLGTKVNAEKAIEFIKQMTLQKSGDSQSTTVEVVLEHSAIARALGSKFQKYVRDVETNHGVSIRINMANGTFGATDASGFGTDVADSVTTSSQPKNSKAPQGQKVDGSRPIAYIRGKPNVVNAAKTEFISAISKLRAIEIPTPTPEALSRLFFSRVNTRRDEMISSGQISPVRAVTQQSASDKFRVLCAANDNVAFLRHDGNLALVGSKEDLEVVYDQAVELLKTASYTPTRMSIPIDVAFIFSQEKLALIECSTGTSIRRLRAGETSVPLEITGSDAQKQAAEKAIEKVLQTEAITESFNFKEPETIGQLMRDTRKALRGIEELNGVRIAVDRTNATCKIIGSTEGIASARASLSNMDDNTVERISKMTIREVKLPSSEIIPRIIGQKGVSIQSIRENSRVDVIDINDEKLIVKIRGAPESCDIAERMLNDIIARHTKAGSTTISSTPPQTATTKKTVQTVIASSNVGGNLGWGEAVADNATAPNSISKKLVLNAEGWGISPHGTLSAAQTLGDEEAFPTLGEAADLGKPVKRVPRRKKKTAVPTTTGSSNGIDYTGCNKEELMDEEKRTDNDY